MVERIRTLLDSRQLTPTQFADLIGVARPIVSHILSGRNKPSLEVVQRILAAMPDLAMPWLLNGSGPMLATVANASGSLAAAGAANTPHQPAPAPPAPASAIAKKQVIVAQSLEQQLDAFDNETLGAIVLPTQAPATGPAPKGAEHSGRVNKGASSRPAAMPKRFVASKPITGLITGEPDIVEAEKPVVSQAASVSASEHSVKLGPPTEVPEKPEPVVGPLAANATAPAGNIPPAVDAGAENAMAKALFAGAEKPIRRIVIFYRDGSFADYQPE